MTISLNKTASLYVTETASLNGTETLCSAVFKEFNNTCFGTSCDIGASLINGSTGNIIYGPTDSIYWNFSFNNGSIICVNITQQNITMIDPTDCNVNSNIFNQTDTGQCN